MRREDHVADSIHLERVCPICDGARRRLLFRQRFYPLPGATPVAGYDVVVCEGCGFAFADRIPAQAVFDAHYRETARYEYSHRCGRETEQDLSRFGDIADSILSHAGSPRGRILDVGCATGGLLATLKSRGCPDVLGLDLSSGCAEAAARLHGVRVLTGTLADVPACEGKFDVLILVGVLEHVRDLGPFLGRVRDLLSPWGIVYIEVPDAANFPASVDAPFQEFSVEHINYFSPDSLGNLTRRHGLAPAWVGWSSRMLGPAVCDPTLSAICRAAAYDVLPPVRDMSTESALLSYIDRSRADEDVDLRCIETLARTGMPVIVWGVGTRALRLIATGRLAEANIVAYVDSSPRLHGRFIRGVPILKPADLAGRDEPIAICSWGHRDEIRRQVREQLRLSNPILDIFDAPSGTA